MLGLDEWATIMGINPVHFSGAMGSTVWPEVGCDDLWPQHAWQSLELTSREELARAIRDAEQEIASVAGFLPAPGWVREEVHPYPANNRSRSTSFRWDKQVSTRYRKVSAPGVRSVTRVGAYAVDYSDADADGWKELALITCPDLPEGVVADEIRVYHPGCNGDPSWEIRPIRSVIIDAGTAVLVADSWLFLRPSLWEAIPTTRGLDAIDIENEDNYITMVEVHYERNDEAAAGCGIISIGPHGNSAIDGTFSVVDAESGIIIPYGATYCDGAWVEDVDCWAVPAMVKINYHSGLFSGERLEDGRRRRMDRNMEEAVAWLSAARLSKPICACTNVQAYVEELRTDLARADRKGYTMLSDFQMNNPFGTKVGEIRAWNQVSKMSGGFAYSAIAI